MNSYLSESFPSLAIKKPLFYSWPIGIRFEIGSSKISLWKNYEKKLINEKYFVEALVRAKSIFELIFKDENDIVVVYQKYSDGRQKIKKRFYLFNQIEHIKEKKITYSDIKGLYNDEDEQEDFKCYCWKRVEIELKPRDCNYTNILNSLINTDFSIRGVSLGGECYFINKSKGIILNLYDDRGMDVIAANKESLVNLYTTYNHWILDYDKDKIDALFKRI